MQKTKRLLIISTLLGLTGTFALAPLVSYQVTETHAAEPQVVSMKEPSRVSVTSPSIAINNLQSQIDSLEKLVSTHPQDPQFKSQLVDALLARTQFLGTYSDFSRIAQLIPQRPATFDEYLLKARFSTAVHEFDTALLALAEAERLNPGNEQVVRLRSSLGVARRQDLSELQAQQAAVVATFPSYANFITMAGIETELGNFDAADRAFVQALNAYRDTSPFPVAFVYFQRGVMWGEKAGDSERARELYKEAVHYLPQYVVAQVHLAEIVSESGDVQAAISAVESVASSQDPEPRGVLGELLNQIGENEKAASHIQSAAQAYDSLLEEFPLAFADHGSEFFSGPGANPARGLELARSNLQNRKTERGYIVAIEAARAASAAEVLCTLVTEAKELAPVYVPLQELIKESVDTCPSAPIVG